MITDANPVTAVVVTYQSRDIVGYALDALYGAHVAGLADAIVVDNASTDGTADLVAESHAWVTLIRNPENLGYGRGCDRGFERVTSRYALMMNPDARVDIHALRTLVEFMERNDQVGVAAPAIVDGDSIQAAGLMTTPASLMRATFGSVCPLSWNRPIAIGGAPFRTSWVCGAIMLIRSDLFRSLGGFDPRLFLYFEETDLCRRVTQRGAEIWAVGTAVAHHVSGASATVTGESLEGSCIAEHFYRSRFYYLVKHFGWIRAIGTETIVRVVQEVRSLRNRLKGREQSRPDRRTRRPFLRFPAQPHDTK